MPAKVDSGEQWIQASPVHGLLAVGDHVGVAVADGHALGPAGGARGVHDVGQVAVADRRTWNGSSAWSDELVPLAASSSATIVAELSAGDGAGLGDDRGQAGRRDGHGRLGVGHQPGQLGGGEPDVGRHGHRPGLVDGRVAGDPAQEVHVVEVEQHPVAPADTRRPRGRGPRGSRPTSHSAKVSVAPAAAGCRRARRRARPPSIAADRPVAALQSSRGAGPASGVDSVQTIHSRADASVRNGPGSRRASSSVPDRGRQIREQGRGRDRGSGRGRGRANGPGGGGSRWQSRSPSASTSARRRSRPSRPTATARVVAQQPGRPRAAGLPRRRAGPSGRGRVARRGARGADPAPGRPRPDDARHPGGRTWRPWCRRCARSTATGRPISPGMLYGDERGAAGPAQPTGRRPSRASCCGSSRGWPATIPTRPGTGRPRRWPTRR